MLPIFNEPSIGLDPILPDGLATFVPNETPRQFEQPGYLSIF